MEQRALGKTGLTVSAVGFGCGAVGGLMVRGEPAAQTRAIARAIEAGFRYFDTAPGYGDGRSEENLGRVLHEVGAPAADVVVGTKFRLDQATAPADVPAAIRRSLEASLRRLRCESVHLLQLHNKLGGEDGLPVETVLGPVAEALAAIRAEGLAAHVGVTATGETAAVHRVVASGLVESGQVYFNALNPSAGWAGHAGPGGQDFAGLIDVAALHDVGVIVIRPFAGGAASGRDERHPNAGGIADSAPIGGTPYGIDLARAQRLAALATELELEGPLELALRFALAKPGVSTIIAGFSDESHLEDAIRWSGRGALPAGAVERVLTLYR